MKKGTVILVTPGKGNLESLESGKMRIQDTIHQLFIIDGVPINRFITSLILRAENKEGISILHKKDPVPWHTTINDLWSTSKPGQTIVVIAPNADIFKIASEIVPMQYRAMLEAYHPPGEIFISTNGNGEFTIISP